MKQRLFLLLLCLVHSAAGAEPLGRLFFTPAQRAQLDNARKQKTDVPPAAAPAQAPLPETATLSGIVKRSDGESTLWINGRAVSGDEVPAGAHLVEQNDGAAMLHLPQADGAMPENEPPSARRPATPQRKGP